MGVLFGTSRAVLLGCAALMILAGLALLGSVGPGSGGLMFVILGGAAMVVLLFERTRYRSEAAERGGQPIGPGGGEPPGPWSRASRRPPRSSSIRPASAGCASSPTRGPASDATWPRTDGPPAQDVCPVRKRNLAVLT